MSRGVASTITLKAKGATTIGLMGIKRKLDEDDDDDDDGVSLLLNVVGAHDLCILRDHGHLAPKPQTKPRSKARQSLEQVRSHASQQQ